MGQLSFLDAPANKSRTSRAAADAIQPYVSHQEAVVLLYVSKQPRGSTREEIAAGTGLRLASVCARANRLVAKGLLTERGERKGSSGRWAAILHGRNQ